MASVVVSAVVGAGEVAAGEVVAVVRVVTPGEVGVGAAVTLVTPVSPGGDVDVGAVPLPATDCGPFDPSCRDTAKRSPSAVVCTTSANNGLSVDPAAPDDDATSADGGAKSGEAN